MPSKPSPDAWDAWDATEIVVPAREQTAPVDPPGTWSWVAIAVGAVVLGVVGVLGFIVPGYFVTTVLDADAVQNGVRTVLQVDYQLGPVTDVVCPDDIKVAPGKNFTCTATVDGTPVDVAVIIRDSNGRYEVARPI